MQSCLQGQNQQRTKATEEGTAGRMSPDLLAQLHPLKPWLPVSTSLKKEKKKKTPEGAPDSDKRSH